MTPTESPAELPADPIRTVAAAQPDKPAVIDDRPGHPVRTWTFAELDAWADRLAGELEDAASHRSGPGGAPIAQQRIAWCGPNSAPVIAAAHAIRRLGATAVPVSYRLTPTEAAAIFRHADAAVVYVDEEHEALVRHAVDTIEATMRPTVITYGTDAAHDAKGQAPERHYHQPHPTPEAPGGSMYYTSGTTGDPKGALRHNGDPATSGALFGALGYRPDDVFLTTGPLYHSGPGGFCARAQSQGHTVVLQRKFDPEDWLRLLATHRVSSTFSAPTPIRMVCALPREVKDRYHRSSMRVMVANAAPWPFSLKLAYLEDFPPESLWEIYGSTELSVNTMLAPADQRRKPGSCGRAAPLNEIRLYDEDGRIVTEPNVPGELYVRSANVFREYFRDPERTAAEHRDGFQTVGDIAYRDEEGFFYICDRKKDMIISGGVNIFPAEIEAVLEAHPGIFEAAVFGIPDDQWGEAVHAAIVPTDPGNPPDEEDVRDHVRLHLAGFKAPRSISVHEELPKTGSGKVLKRALRDPYWAT